MEDKIRSIPKLPKGSYDLPREEFKILIRKYKKPIRIKLMKQRKRFRKAMAGIRKKMSETGTVSTLTPMQKMEVIELSSKFYTPTQILKIIKEEWGHEGYKNKSLNSLLKNNRELILKKRERYVSSTKNLRLTHERARLEELQEMYEEAKDEDDKKIQIDILKEIRTEVKGDKLVLEGNLNADINLNVKQNLLTTIDTASIVQLSMLQLFAKHNINSLSFMHRLKIDNQVRDPQTNQIVVGKKLPIKMDEKSFLIEEKSQKTLEEINNKKLGNVDPESVKDRLKRLLRNKTKKIDKALEKTSQIPILGEEEENEAKE